MNKLEKIKFEFTNVDGELDLYNYGKFRLGLTGYEIEQYIKARANKLNVKRLIKKFNDIAGCNTMSCYTCPNCKDMRGLMYRHDVLRFADVLFGKTNGTYFD